MSRQSSGKSASRQRSYERSSSDVKERCSREHASSERVTPCFRESDLQLARCFSTVQLAPPHGRLVESDGSYGAEPRPCPGLLGGPTVLWCLITFGKDKLMDLYTCIIMQGINLTVINQSSHLSLAFFRDQTPHKNTHYSLYRFKAWLKFPHCPK